MAKQLLTMGLLMTLSPPAFALGTISLTSTAYPDSVVITATITDTGGSPECGYLTFLRNGVQTNLFIERQIGTTITRTVVDTDVEPSTLYCYTMDFRQFPIPVFLLCGDFWNAFDQFCQIQTCVNTGPNPALLGRGLLSEFYPGGGEVDHNETQAILLDCESPSTILLGLHSIPPEAEPYLDSGQVVRVFGAPFCCWAQCVWLTSATHVEPSSCVIATEPTTWGRVKALYRD